MNVQLSDYFCGGYVLTRPADRKEANPTLPVDKVISISRDVCEFFPDSWALDWARNSERDLEEVRGVFELNEEQIKEISGWARNSFGAQFGAWYVIYRLETARFLKNKFLNHLSDSKLLGIGLHKTLAPDFLKKLKAPPSKPGFAPNGEAGAYEVIIEQRLLEEGGKPLGFEPVVADAVTTIALGCSWLCNQLELDALKNHIPINEFGLIDDYEAALKFVGLANRGDLGAEPGLWLPWLLVDYSTTG